MVIITTFGVAALAALLQQMRDFGMTPSSRSRVTAVPVEETPVDDMEIFLSRRDYQDKPDPRDVLRSE